jgi:aspartyl-tRNA(Asn)/glutamyl-tRNA(Gln) amidotransferase subunit A
MTIGIPEEYFNQSLQPEVQKTIEEVIKTYQSLGIKFKSVSLPHTKYALSCYYIIMPAEASSNLARFDSIRFANVSGVNREQENLSDLYKKSKTIGFGPEPKRRIILGTFVLSSGYYDAYYKKAQQVRNYFKDDFTFAFSQVNAILAPVSPTTAFKIGERTNDPMSMYLSDILTIPANLAGLPAISIPSKNPIGSLPINFQLIGPKWHDQEILNLGQLYQES